MRKTYRYRLFPTKAQTRAMQKALDACRWVYNKVLEVRHDAWEEREETYSLYDTIKMLPGWKAEHPFLKDAYSQSLQNVCIRVDLAFKAFFRRVKAGEEPGYPRFRGRDFYDSFTYPQDGFRLIENRLRLSKIGDVKIVLHRPIEGRVKTLTIKRSPTGKWFASFSVEVEARALPPLGSIVGIDVGLTHFATLSTGEVIPNPRFFKQEEKALAKAQRRLSEAERGTSERRKLRKVVARIHERIASKRLDFAHKLSAHLIETYQVIAFEKLDIQEMQEGNWRSINRSIADVAWAQFRQLTTAKAREAGRVCVEVEPRGTTQGCSGCGAIVPKDLSVRTHSCPSCGLVLGRDLNSALNILALGLQSLGSS